MPFIVFLTPIIAFLAFVIWDRKQLSKALSRDQFAKGFVPGSGATWPIFLWLSLLGFCVARIEFNAPSVPPFRGRGSMFEALAYQAFGHHGLMYIGLFFGAAFVIGAYVSYRSSQQR